jgi:hypothetical protein
MDAREFERTQIIGVIGACLSHGKRAAEEDARALGAR